MPEEDRIGTELLGAEQHAQGIVRDAARLAARSAQDSALRSALEHVDGVREFLGDPNRIIGNPNTKHGEIAEHVEVGIRNARQVIENLAENATFDGVGRTAPADYLVDGIEVQSKFINGLNKNLEHVLGHLEKHEGFSSDGAYYHIPKDHFAKIEAIARGESVEGLAEKTVRAVEAKLGRIRELTGRDLGDVVRPGSSEYAEVQKGRVFDTLGKHEGELRERNSELKHAIDADHAVGWQDGVAAAGKGAAVGAALRFGVGLYKKRKERGAFGALTEQDWKELGLEAGKGGLQGGVAAGALFVLTHSTDLPAPFAGSFVSAAMGLKALADRRRSGEIDDVEFVELGQVVCAEAAIVALATTAGQALIPVPVLGAVVGALAGRVAAGAGKWVLSKSEQALLVELDERFGGAMAQRNEEHERLLGDITVRFERLGEVSEIAFDLERNVALRLSASIEMAEEHGVPGDLILRSQDGLDAFMRGE